MSTRLQDLFALSHVPRWTTHPVARKQSVAEHSYRVAILAQEIWERLPENSRAQISVACMTRWAMLHDGPEAKIGDIPSPVKKFIGVTEIARMERTVCDWYEAEVRKPSAAEYSIVHIADSIEALSWISRYGSGFRDRFDGHDIEDGLRKRVHIEALSSPIEGLAAAVQSVLGEVAT